MSVEATDLVFYGAAVMPEDDTTGSVGGAIDPLRRVYFDDISATGLVEVLSNGTGDGSKTATVTGRLADGSIDSEVIAISGSADTPTSGALNFERILKVELSANATGIITVRKASDDVTIGIIPAGERGFRRPFYGAASSPSAGKILYEKFFIKNNHGTLALTQSIVSESADPQTNIEFALDTALDGTTSSTNRLTAPASGVGTFDNSAKNVPNSQNLSPGSAIGVWLKLTLAQGAAAYKSTYTPQIAGSSV